MSDYSEIFLDHYRRPRNLGDLADADAIAIVHDDVCGDVLRLAVALEAGDRRVAAARFKAYGCAATIAAGSMLTERVVGRTVDELTSLSADDLITALGGLPAGRVHAAVLAAEALRRALARLV